MSKYDGIINLPHHVSERHPRMPLLDRAAQFSPFAALTGYDAAIRETARLTDPRIELTDEEKTILDVKLRKAIRTGETVSLICFEQDQKKSGGTYNHVSGQVRRFDGVAGVIHLNGGKIIPVQDIYEVVFDDREMINAEMHTVGSGDEDKNKFCAIFAK